MTKSPNLTSQDVERLKRAGRYAHAGALSATLGHAQAFYGSHYGKRSDLTYATLEFNGGFRAATAAMATEAEMAAYSDFMDQLI